MRLNTGGQLSSDGAWNPGPKSQDLNWEEQVTRRDANPTTVELTHFVRDSRFHISMYQFCVKLAREDCRYNTVHRIPEFDGYW